MNSSSAGVRDRQVRKLGWIAHPRAVMRKIDKSDPVARQERRDDGRAERWELRRGYRKLSRLKRVQSCGHPGTRPDGSVLLQVTDATGTTGQATTGAAGRVAGFRGLFQCGNVHVCAWCSARVAAVRAAELETVLAHYVSTGGWAMLVTLTMRHWRDHPLAQCVEALRAGWQAVNGGGTWDKHKKLTDYAGYARVIETNHGQDNGWHQHVHAVIVFNSRPSLDAMNAVADGMFSRWSTAIVAAGMPAPTREHGIDVQHLDPDVAEGRTFETARAWAKYVAKGIAAEATLGVGKGAKGTNRTIRELLRDAVIPQTWEEPDSHTMVQTVDLHAQALLAEYEQATRGQKMMTWSRDIRAAAKLAEEVDDEKLVEDVLDGQDVAIIPRTSWVIVEPRAPELLAATERDGAAGAYRWLDAIGVEWWHPTGLTEHLGRLERSP